VTLPVTVQVEDPASPEIGNLIAQLDAYQLSLYPAESNHLLPIETLRQSHVTFLTARMDDGRVAACGAFVNHGRYAEIKRMFVTPEFRGRGLGRRLLNELEARIRAAGLELVRLETGIRHDEALGLYEKAGYRRCGRFGEYPDDPLSVFMEKDL
jgi:putative acetyltransferase